MTTRYRTVDVDGINVFFRVLHGFPTSSHMFRELIPALADRYRVVAPDLPGFGFTDAPDRTNFTYTFDHFSDVIERFTEVLSLDHYAIYIFDYGAPIGLRLAMRHPERIVAVISQNGNAYLEGLSDGWNPIQTYWKNPSQENRAALRGFLTPEATHTQYATGVPTPELLLPDAWTLDSAFSLALAMTRSSSICSAITGAAWLSIQNSKNISAQDAPATCRLGKERPVFRACRRQSITRDIPDTEVHLLEAGHFALESHGQRSRQSSATFLRAN